MDIWTIYDHPTDYPTGFIARRFDTDKPTGDIITGKLSSLRLYFADLGLVCMARDPSDDPVIVETWM